MAATSIKPLSPPERLLVGPGPANFTPSVLAAMQKPILGTCAGCKADNLSPGGWEILWEQSNRRSSPALGPVARGT